MNKLLSILLVILILPIATFAKFDEATPVWPNGNIQIVVEDSYRIDEEKLLTFEVNAITTTNVEPDYSVRFLPEGAIFRGNTFSWKPDCGVVEVTPWWNPKGWFKTDYNTKYFYPTFTVVDNHGNTDSKRVQIAVHDVCSVGDNNAPVLSLIGNKEICAGDVLEFNVKGSDVDGDKLSYYTITTYSHEPWIFNEGNGHFYWNTNKIGTKIIIFGVTDGFLSDEETIKIKVVDCQSEDEESDGKKKLSTMSAYSFENKVSAGETLYINTHVRNLGQVREHIRARVIIPALNVYISKYINLDEQDDANKVIEVEIPENAKKGEYLALVDLTSRTSSDNEYVIFEVV